MTRIGASLQNALRALAAAFGYQGSRGGCVRGLRTLLKTLQSACPILGFAPPTPD